MPCLIFGRGLRVNENTRTKRVSKLMEYKSPATLVRRKTEQFRLGGLSGTGSVLVYKPDKRMLGCFGTSKDTIISC